MGRVHDRLRVRDVMQRRDRAAADPDALVDDLDAVSYTHLRAHETVLDLVCRLLLEKKKTQIQLDHDGNKRTITRT